MNLNIKISSYALFVDSDSDWYLSEEVSCAQADVEAGLHDAAHTHLHLEIVEVVEKLWNGMGWKAECDVPVPGIPVPGNSSFF